VTEVQIFLKNHRVRVRVRARENKCHFFAPKMPFLCQKEGIFLPQRRHLFALKKASFFQYERPKMKIERPKMNLGRS